MQASEARPHAADGSPSWLQRMLSNFVDLRHDAAEEEREGRLLCMPVVLTASTQSSSSLLDTTAGRGPQIRDLHLQPLSDANAEDIVLHFLRRVSMVSKLPDTLPATVRQLLQLCGGNPRLIAWTLSSLSGCKDLQKEDYLIGETQCCTPSSGVNHSPMFLVRCAVR